MGARLRSPNWVRSTCREVPDMETGRAVRKVSAEWLPAPDLAMAWPPETAPAAVKPSEPAVKTIPAEITFKPRPVYTEEGKRLKVEGEVLLEVVFTAGGQVQVQRVLQ